MPKGYWIGHIDVTDGEAYKPYMAAAAAVVAKFGGRYLVRGGKAECVGGQVRARNVILEFPSFAEALACWNSPEYRAVAPIRERNSEGDFVVVEGLAP